MGALLAIELATGKRTRCNADDGLPFVDGGFDFNYLDHMQVAAVAPGHVCLAASIERTWIANVKLTADGKSRWISSMKRAKRRIATIPRRKEAQRLPSSRPSCLPCVARTTMLIASSWGVRPRIPQ